MPQEKRKSRGGQANVSGAVTAERLRIRRRIAEGGRDVLSAAERVVMNPQATGESQKAAAKALKSSRRLIKKSPGYTVEIGPDHWPNEDGSAKGELADTHNSTDDHAKPTIR
jgi:hypothetical protein